MPCGDRKEENWFCHTFFVAYKEQLSAWVYTIKDSSTMEHADATSKLEPNPHLWNEPNEPVTYSSTGNR